MQEPDPAAVDRRGLPADLTTAETRGAMQPAPKRSAAGWLFQLTTITLGVLIALAFDAALRGNADRALVAEARATVGLEVASNRSELEDHLTTFTERMAQLNNVMTLLDELDAGVEPT